MACRASCEARRPRGAQARHSANRSSSCDPSEDTEPPAPSVIAAQLCGRVRPVGDEGAWCLCSTAAGCPHARKRAASAFAHPAGIGASKHVANNVLFNLVLVDAKTLAATTYNAQTNTCAQNANAWLNMFGNTHLHIHSHTHTYFLTRKGPRRLADFRPDQSTRPAPDEPESDRRQAPPKEERNAHTADITARAAAQKCVARNLPGAGGEAL